MVPARFIVTGSTGFVGTRVLALLGDLAVPLRLGHEQWEREIEQADFANAVVVHTAARAHQAGREEDYQRDNVEKTRALAHAAARHGAARFVFLSSIKVNGESTQGQPFKPEDAPAPEDAYGRSKRDAEALLSRMRDAGELETVILRSPLVLGAPVKGNLATLLRWADSPWPLPLASIRNRRSFVHVEDLASLLLECARQPRAAGELYLAAHPEPFSTPDLVARLRDALGRKRRLYAAPASALELAASFLGQGAAVRRLTRSLEVDASHAEQQLGWRARRGLDDSVDEMARWHRART